MTDPKGVGLTLKHMASLHQMSVAELRKLLDEPVPMAISAFKKHFSYADALEIEVARQMSDHFGIPIQEALRLSCYAAALKEYSERAQTASGRSQDFWFAVAASRNSRGSSQIGTVPVTRFGPKEYWAEEHYTGTLGAVVGAISEAIGRDQCLHPDSDPARIFMTNISAADRRLCKRAAEMGLDLA